MPSLANAANPSGEPRSNIVPEPHSLPIHDIRPISETISLDREGFALIKQKSAVKDFYNEDEVKNVYYAEAERLIKQATGAVDHDLAARMESLGVGVRSSLRALRSLLVEIYPPELRTEGLAAALEAIVWQDATVRHARSDDDRHSFCNRRG